MCLNPIKAWKVTSSLSGEVSIVFKFPKTAKHVEQFPLPCGKCIECCEQYSREWSFRIAHEARNHSCSCCLTLTYDNEHLPSDLSLCRRDVQLFLKVLRRHLSCKIRYFGCAEYGSHTFRPHYHIIIFGYDFPDKLFWSKSKSGGVLYRSEELSKYWKHGYSYVGELSLASAKYCAKYLQKYVFDTVPCLQGRVRPFTFMSTHPGIGGDYRSCLTTDKLYIDGYYVKTPRYYLKLSERDGYDLSSIREARVRKAKLFARSSDELRSKRRSVEKRFSRDLHISR